MNQPVTNIILGTMTFGYRGYGARVHDPETVRAMLAAFHQAGYSQLDTAYPYGDGTCEEMLGELGAPATFSIGTRFDPLTIPGGHEPEKLKSAFRESLRRLRASRVSILYLNTRDRTTPLAQTMQAVQDLFEAGLFDELGLSNVAVDDVEQVLELSGLRDWIRPTVYQGLYNAVSRSVEQALLPLLSRENIRLHAYNPLAGGAFAPNFGEEAAVETGSRFDTSHRQGQTYRSRYWNDAYLGALRDYRQACDEAGLDPISVALRWLVHHSAMDGARNDGVIIGASSLRHLQHNLEAVQAGPLPGPVLAAIEIAGEKTRPNWPPFSLSR